MEKLIIALIAAVSGICFAVAEESTTVAAKTAAESAALVQNQAVEKSVVTPTDSQKEASVKAASEDALVVIDADEKISAEFDAFLEAKEGAGVVAYGTPTASGIIYYSASEPISAKGPADPDFMKKRQTAFMRAFSSIRNDYVKYTFNSTLTSTEKGELLSDAAALQKQTGDQLNALKRLAMKVQALTEAKIDAQLRENGVDPAKYSGIAAKRKQLCNSIVREAVMNSFGSCVGISVVKTIEGRGTDGQYSLGVIAKYDPSLVVVADSMRRKMRPATAPKKGIDVGQLLKGKVAYNFGTRFYYDEDGEPALLSFGQWGIAGDVKDRMERKLLEKSAFVQAESQANIDLNNFIAGSVSFTEVTKAGEDFAKWIVYNDEGLPVNFEKSTDIVDFVNQRSVTRAQDTMAGRSVVFKKMVTHPDTKAKIAVVAVNWSYKKLDQLVRDQELRKPQPPPAVKNKDEKTKATVRSGDTYDF